MSKASIPVFEIGRNVLSALLDKAELRASGPDAVYYATRLSGASKVKTLRELGFRSRQLEWI